LSGSECDIRCVKGDLEILSSEKVIQM
jgi:hypothetical protein